MDNKVLDLLEIRDQIDGIDKEIVELFEKRMQLSAEVAEYKISNNKAVLDSQREKEKLNTLEKYASNSFNRVGVYELFRQMMAMSRKLQYRILAEKGKAEKIPFRKVSSLPMQKAKVVFQGVEGAYSFTAMHSFFGESIENYNVETWRDAMEAIKNGDADYAVLPIENSTAGIVADIYDLLVEYHHSIVGEQIIQVDHALMGLKNATLEDIKTVYSHPQALSQCRKFLEQHPEWKAEEYLNTAMAAKIYQEEAGKISVCFEIPHESGSLYNTLSHFIYNDLNMTKIESRPIPEKKWEYRFFVDFEGNLSDSGVKNALYGISREVNNLRILGNY